jgi:hypothetical protein
VAKEPEGSPPHSQQLAAGPYLEPFEPNPYPQSISLRYIVIPFSHLRLDTAAANGFIVHSPDDMSTESRGRMAMIRENYELGESAPVFLCLQQVPHGLVRARNRASGVRIRRLTA